MANGEIREETKRSRYWRRQVKAWESSGLTQVAFCQQKGLSLPAFRWWRGEFKKQREAEHEEKTSRTAECVRRDEGTEFIPVVLREAAEEENGQIEVILRSGHRVSVLPHFDTETLQRVVQVLEGTC
jgi:hypothetical protein